MNFCPGKKKKKIGEGDINVTPIVSLIQKSIWVPIGSSLSRKTADDFIDTSPRSSAFANGIASVMPQTNLLQLYYAELYFTWGQAI